MVDEAGQVSAELSDRGLRPIAYHGGLSDEERAVAQDSFMGRASDVVVATEFAASAEADVKPVADVAADEMVLDIGPDTAEQFAAALTGAGTIVWNGPLGVFEFDQFGEGTRAIAQAVARSPAFSIAGGGDTIAAIEKYGVGQDISYISTAGGAFLEFLEGKKLPAVEVLEARAAG